MTEARIVSLPYSEIRSELLAFRNANREQTRDVAYLDWRYCGRPNGEAPIVVHAEDTQGRMIGSLTLIPHHFSMDGATCLVGLLGDISVAEACRGQGIAGHMLEHLANLDQVHRLAACLVMPNAAASKVLGRAGWRAFTELRRHVAFLPAVPGLPPLGVHGIGRIAAKVLGGAASLKLRLPWSCFEEYGVSPVEAFDESFDDLWQQARTRIPILAFRDSAYLTWRYTNHPSFRYSVLALRHREKLQGYVVFYVDGGRCHVVDLLCRDGMGAVDWCLQLFIRFVRDERMASVVVVSGMPQWLSLVKRYSIGLVRRPSALTCMIQGDEAAGSAQWTASRWFLTAGDKDT